MPACHPSIPAAPLVASPTKQGFLWGLAGQWASAPAACAAPSACDTPPLPLSCPPLPTPGGSPDPAVTALLLAAGRGAATFPADIAAAIANGRITAEVLRRFLELETKFLIGWLMQFQGGSITRRSGGDCRREGGNCITGPAPRTPSRSRPAPGNCSGRASRRHSGVQGRHKAACTTRAYPRGV
jgi:hypothetical protein